MEFKLKTHNIFAFMKYYSYALFSVHMLSPTPKYSPSSKSPIESLLSSALSRLYVSTLVKMNSKKLRTAFYGYLVRMRARSYAVTVEDL